MSALDDDDGFPIETIDLPCEKLQRLELHLRFKHLVALTVTPSGIFPQFHVGFCVLGVYMQVRVCVLCVCSIVLHMLSDRVLHYSL